MTKLQFIRNFVYLIVLPCYWHEGCQYFKQSEIMYV